MTYAPQPGQGYPQQGPTPGYQPQAYPQQGYPQQPGYGAPQGYPEPSGNYVGLQGQPPTAYPAQVAPAHLRVHLQGSVLTSSMITPTLLINNQVVQASYGPNDYQLPPGAYHVSAYAQWLRRYGQAAVDVMLQPGQGAEVFYAAPWHQFTTGSMGFAKQHRKGTIFLVATFAILFGVFALIGAAPLLAGR